MGEDWEACIYLAVLWGMMAESMLKQFPLVKTNQPLTIGIESVGYGYLT